MLLTEMNGPKVGIAALVKSGYMLGRPVDPPVLARKASNNPRGAGNQQERSDPRIRNPQRLHAGRSLRLGRGETKI